MIDNSLANLLENIEPKIQNIEEKRIELKALDDVKRTMEELIQQAEDSPEEILNFYDENFIIRAIKIKNANYKDIISKYYSSKYLLKNKDFRIAQLPQYQESLSFVESLYKYLYGLCEEIRWEFKNKSEDLEIEELQNKYYLLLNKENVFIDNIDEFLTFIKLNNISNLDKLNIYKQICKFNIRQYTKYDKIMIDDNISLNDVEILLERNNSLLAMEYFETPDLEKSLTNYLQEVNEIEENNITNRKIYLLHKIKKIYENKEYIEIINYYKEVVKIEDLEEEFKKQKEVPRELLFVFKNDESLVRIFLNKVEYKYKNCVLKNLLDIENDNTLSIPIKKYVNRYLYQKEEFLVKTIYTFLENGKVLILGILNKGETLDSFLQKNDELYKNTFNHLDTISLIKDERDLLLKNIKLEDLVLNIDLETLDVKREEKNAR